MRLWREQPVSYGPVESLTRVIRFGVPEPTEGQRIGDQIDSTSIFAGADFVNVCRGVVMANPGGYSNRPPLRKDMPYTRAGH
jgi:hypothetical protein